MRKINPKLMAGAALAAALLAGCGGSDHGDNSGGGGTSGPIAQTVTEVAAFITNLFAGNNDNNEPIDVNALTLVASDGAEPAPQP